jgi:hypothetical protein
MMTQIAAEAQGWMSHRACGFCGAAVVWYLEVKVKKAMGMDITRNQSPAELGPSSLSGAQREIHEYLRIDFYRVTH